MALNKILYIVSLAFILVVLGYRLADEPLPEGESGPRAEYLAEKMLDALNYGAWDRINAIAWTYPRGHHYLWDKQANLVRVQWDDYTVLLNPETKAGKAYENDKPITEDVEDVINQALKYFINDSFWLIAPFKVKDPGTFRQAVTHNGQDALLVQYSSGGVTPGDSYLWILDDKGVPTAWKFWVSIVPVGGIEFTWDNWLDLEGAKIATLHKGIFTIEITNLKSANNVKELNKGKDPFLPIR